MKCPSCVALRVQLDCVAESLGDERMARAEGVHYEAVDALIRDAQCVGKVRSLVEYLADEVDGAKADIAARGRGGQYVPFFGDFANSTPRVLNRLGWWVREMKTAITGVNGCPGDGVVG